MSALVQQRSLLHHTGFFSFCKVRKTLFVETDTEKDERIFNAVSLSLCALIRYVSVCVVVTATSELQSPLALLKQPQHIFGRYRTCLQTVIFVSVQWCWCTRHIRCSQINILIDVSLFSSGMLWKWITLLLHLCHH